MSSDTSLLPIPYGWFQVGFAGEVPVGSVEPLQYFGRHLVLWRDESGVAHLNDAFCPHLGAHLGHGGKVVGEEIACPFHGWQFNPEGKNTKIPYSARVKRSCTLGSYPVIERNGFLMAWFHPEGAAPEWEIPEIAEFGDSQNFSEVQTREFHVAAAWQEMAENGADSAHFGFVHGQSIVPSVDSFDIEGPILRMRSTQRWPTPTGDVDGFVEATNYGPGFSVIRMTGIIDTVSIGCNTPVSDGSCHMRFAFTVKRVGDDAVTAMIGDGFINLLTEQIGEDARIWEHKTYLERPALSAEDGPIMTFRTWAQQFYAPATWEADSEG